MAYTDMTIAELQALEKTTASGGCKNAILRALAEKQKAAQMDAIKSAAASAVAAVGWPAGDIEINDDSIVINRAEGK